MAWSREKDGNRDGDRDEDELETGLGMGIETGMGIKTGLKMQKEVEPETGTGLEHSQGWDKPGAGQEEQDADCCGQCQ